MDLSRRDFMQIAAALGISAMGSGCSTHALNDISTTDIMDFKDTGNITLLHMCDMHAHIKPLYWREPSTLISAPALVGKPAFICGQPFQNYYGLKKDSLNAYFDTHLNFNILAKKFGKMGGIAYMKTIIDEIKRDRGAQNVLLLDSGDTWQGTGLALETRGEAIVEAQNYLGVDVMVGHWEFTYGKERVHELIEKLNAEFISQNIIDNDPFSDEFEELIFEPYTIKEVGGAKIGIIGQSFPFTSNSNPKRFTEGWSFGLRADTLQEYVDELRDEKGVDSVVMLSHDGFSVDQEIAKKVKGIDFILSGHTHDPSPKPIIVNQTVIMIAGSHGKYIGRLDLDVKNKKVVGYNYKLIPVASNILQPEPEGIKLVDKLYAPYDKKMNEVLGKTQTTLYKRDTFHSTFDQLINDSIIDTMDSEIAFTPGYRWGTTVLEGEDILMDHVYDMTAITYPEVFTFELKGERIKTLLEDIADNVFNPNPLYQQGGDMSRLAGITYDIKISAPAGKRITNLKVNGFDIKAGRMYKISSWGGNLQNIGQNLEKSKIAPVYDVTANYIRRKSNIHISKQSNVNIVDVFEGCPVAL